MNDVYGFEASLIPILRIVAALCAGGAIGLERTFHGSAAGFRTYALVCMGSAMAVLVTMFPNAVIGGTVNAPGDLTRVVQGILTGIGFLGAGVIVKYGYSVRGLTTAASIWTTAVIGVLIGIGFFWAAAASVVLVLATLSVLRILENRMRMESFLDVKLSVSSENGIPHENAENIIQQAGLRIEQSSCAFDRAQAMFEYEYLVSSFDPKVATLLADQFEHCAGVLRFRISPSQD
jgi:putative Mg2+ transporter-C (MgtC) family protein